MQDLPDQAAQPVGNHADRLVVPEPRDIAAIEDLEDRPFFTAALAAWLPLRGPVTVVHRRALVLAGAGAHPGGELARGRKRSRPWGRPRPESCCAESTPRPGTSASRWTWS